MRVLMSLAFAAIAAVGMSGCQTVCTTCDTGCGTAVTEIAPGCGVDAPASCGCSDAVAATDSSCGCGSTGCDSGCGGQCDGSCGVGGGGLLGRLTARAAAGSVVTGEYVQGCNDGSCGTCADGSCSTAGVAQAGGLLGELFGRRAATAQYHAAGCGVNGCGVGGHMCGRCRSLAGMGMGGRAAANHPYGGMSPHTPPMTGPYGPMSPHYGYPYYTTRGPRDFFEANPSSLGR